MINKGQQSWLWKSHSKEIGYGSTLKINNLDTVSGTTITIPTGKQLIGTDTNSIDTPGMIVQAKTPHS